MFKYIDRNCTCVTGVWVTCISLERAEVSVLISHEDPVTFILVPTLAHPVTSDRAMCLPAHLLQV